MSEALPIEAIRAELPEALERGPVVITSPTGSGKSTQVPRWCPGRVLVVEPRRVACKTLALRVAELEECELGAGVGFHVRDHRVESADTRVLFATPGVVLRRFDELGAFQTVVLDEFHERTLEVDLILALLRRRQRGQLVVMSATLRPDPLVAYLDGSHLHAEGRIHPVATLYAPDGVILPEAKTLRERVGAAVTRALAEQQGDVLVFLPGKGEIAGAADELAGRTGIEVLPLHGALSLDRQARVFQPADRRKVVLATNVAETSVTVPGIGAVIDSGLVRRTRYHRGRGFLTLMPIAADSAEQRAGRAGRTGPGVCYRLWSEQARLEPTTPPEIRREALLPLVLAAAACNARTEDLQFLDPPEEYAVAAASEDGRALGALDEQGTITATGRDLFGLPLDPPLGRLLIEAKGTDSLLDAVDLVAALAVGRPLFRAAPRREDDQGLRASGCDATGLVAAVRRGEAHHDELSQPALSEARQNAKRLRRVVGLPERIDREAPFDREALALVALRSDPRTAHVARHRRGRTYWSNGGTEIELGRESAAELADNPKALVVYEIRALGVGQRKTRIVATCASPVRLSLLSRAGLGRERVARVTYKQGRLLARIERVFAKKELAHREEEPRGELARQAIVQLLLDARLFRGSLAAVEERLREHAFVARLPGEVADQAGDADLLSIPLELEPWLSHRLREMGVESGEDIPLLAPEDLVPPPLPPEVAALVEREFPRELSSGGARYAVEYDLQGREISLRWVQGHRGRCPDRASLPAFRGFTIRVDTGRGSQRLR
ncbi:MAG: ATP-dependent RNA helicase [Deltaproteobacteria bacterium]|jgi:ATP-dependent helicase HrpB|nr:ATP-dependent RNA helicase [Deltaproteobacteria bacterium]MBW2537830.1 ATP-dependent RNA helicase [Deltaproteobacteria bacterium]